MADEANENLDSQTEEVVEETTEVVESEEDVASLKEQLAKKDEANKKLYERAKKAETEAKELKSKQPETINQPDLSEELKLIARGLSDEEIEQAKIISKGRDISLQESIKDPMFLAFQKGIQDAARKEKAKLSASKGSPQENESGIKPEMSREEHLAAFNKANGK